MDKMEETRTRTEAAVSNGRGIPCGGGRFEPAITDSIAIRDPKICGSDCGTFDGI